MTNVVFSCLLAFQGGHDGGAGGGGFGLNLTMPPVPLPVDGQSVVLAIIAVGVLVLFFVAGPRIGFVMVKRLVRLWRRVS